MPLVAHEGVHAHIERLTREIQSTSDPKELGRLHLRRGDFFVRHRDFEKARADYARAASLLPDSNEIDLHLGVMHLDAGDAGAAKDTLDRYLGRVPNDIPALVARGRSLALLGRMSSAARDFRRAISLFRKPAHPPPYLFVECANALAASGPAGVAAAIRELDSGVAHLGHLIVLDLRALDLEVESGAYDAALRRLEGILRRSPRRERWLCRRGEILEKSGRMAEAAAAYHQGLRSIETLPATRRGSASIVRLKTKMECSLGRLKLQRTRKGRD